MTFRWRHQAHGEVEILSLSGHIGAAAPDLINATAGEKLIRGDRPLIVDLAEMAGWGHGRSALVNVLRRLAAHRRVMVVKPHDKLTLWALRENGPPVELFPDLHSALDSCEAGADTTRARTATAD